LCNALHKKAGQSHPFFGLQLTDRSAYTLFEYDFLLPVNSSIGLLGLASKGVVIGVGDINAVAIL